MSVKHIKLTEVTDCINEAKDAGKVPMFLDASGNVDTFFSYQMCTVIEAKKLLVDKMQGKSVDDLREGLRHQLVTALKYGNYLLVRMANSAVDIKRIYCDPTTFPVEVFDVDFCENEKKYTKIVRQQDLDTNRNFCPRGYMQVVVTSSFEPEDHAEFLNDALPLDKFMVFHVKG
eukprot:GDKI01042684.1.p2 GENE.GDKI01042684.1~~GDKI01042684.1.p2  ORF type:complete len:174 (-),score=39.75 GDKI01042684.1:323-844(-)